VAESYTLIRMRLGHTSAHEFLGRLRLTAQVARVFVAEAWEAEAETILADFVDQDFSYVDATSFVVMRRLHLDTAFAFDHHFSVAGFVLATSE
jgi:predicted nucleic acid-binding protein